MTTTHELLKRIERLERTAHRAERSAGRYRMLTAGLGLMLIAGVALAAARPTLDVLTTNRLEIVDDQGHLLAAMGAGVGGGQLDLWSTEGRNILRATANDNGGDLTLWNDAGNAVVAAYATASGGESAVWNSDGGRAFRAYADAGSGRISVHAQGDPPAILLGTDRNGGTLEVFDTGGTSVLTGQALSTGGSWAVRNTNGHPVVVSAVDDGHHGVNVLAAADGTTRLWNGVTERGGVSRLYNDQHSVVITQGTSGATGDGYLHVANARGQRTVSAATEDNGGGRLDVINAEGGRVISAITTPGAGGGLALMSRNGTQMVVFDSNLVGGRLTLMNGLGLPSVFVGAAEDGRGGVMSLWNGRNSQVTEIGASEAEDGHLRLWDATGGRRRDIDPG